MTTIKEALEWGRLQLAAKQSSSLDALVLLVEVAGLSKTRIVAEPERIINSAVLENYRALVKKRVSGEPVAYLLGKREFWGLEFKVNKDVLIPRPETELLVELGLKSLASKVSSGKNLQILELGVGSGCISTALGLELKKRGASFSLFGIDICRAALQVAKYNLDGYELGSCSKLAEGSWWQGVRRCFPGEVFDLVISNPPYVSDSEQSSLAPELGFEPAQALFSGHDGLSAYREILMDLGHFVDETSYFFGEIGSSQGELIKNLVHQCEPRWPIAPKEMSIVVDYSGLDRVLAIEF